MFVKLDHCPELNYTPEKLHNMDNKNDGFQVRNLLEKKGSFSRCKMLPWKSKTKQRMVFRILHVKDSLLPIGKSLVFGLLGISFRGCRTFYLTYISPFWYSKCSKLPFATPCSPRLFRDLHPSLPVGVECPALGDRPSFQLANWLAPKIYKIIQPICCWVQHLTNN